MRIQGRENRLGRFSIPDHTLRHQWEDLLHVFGNFVVVSADYKYDTGRIEYMAYSPLFEVVPDHCRAPAYELEIHEMPDGPAVIKAIKLEGELPQIWAK